MCEPGTFFQEGLLAGLIKRIPWSRAVLAAAGLLAVTFPVAAQESCLEFEAYLSPGDRFELTVTDGSWLEVITRFDRVYGFTVSAVPGTVFEIWSLDTGYKMGEDCAAEDDLIASGVVSESVAILDWTDPTPGGDGLKIRLPANTGPTTITLELVELAAPPSNDVLVVPAVAHTRGVRGELFQSDLVVFNPLGVEVPAALVLVTGGGLKRRVEIVVGAYESVAFEDIVATVFGLEDAVGALRVEGPIVRALKLVSRTYALTGVGTYGQFVPALSFNDAATLGYRGAVRVLPHLAKSDEFRSNLGFVEVFGLEADVDLRMVDEAGDVLAAAELTVPPFAHRQINDVFGFLGAEGHANAAVRLELTSHGRVFTYASVVDNRSSDPIFVPGLIPDSAAPFMGWPDQSNNLLVYAAASTRGAFGTRWRTDLRVLPSEAGIGALEVTFVPNDGSASSIGTFEFIGSGPLAVDDVVSRLGASGAGHLRLHSPGGTMLATSRTYTTDDGGSYGQFIPTGWSLGHLDRGVVLGLRGNEHYRSNVGLVNPFLKPVEVELRLVSAVGELLGSRVDTLGADQGRQINDIFRVFGVVGCDLCRLEFEVASDIGPKEVYVWGSVVDNRSGDAIFVPPIRY